MSSVLLIALRCKGRLCPKDGRGFWLWSAKPIFGPRLTYCTIPRIIKTLPTFIIMRRLHHVPVSENCTQWFDLGIFHRLGLDRGVRLGRHRSPITPNQEEVAPNIGFGRVNRCVADSSSIARRSKLCRRVHKVGQHDRAVLD